MSSSLSSTIHHPVERRHLPLSTTEVVATTISTISLVYSVFNANLQLFSISLGGLGFIAIRKNIRERFTEPREERRESVTSGLFTRLSPLILFVGGITVGILTAYKLRGRVTVITPEVPSFSHCKHSFQCYISRFFSSPFRIFVPAPTPQGRVPVGRQAPTFAVRQAPHPTPPAFEPPAPHIIPPPTPQGRVPVGRQAPTFAVRQAPLPTPPPFAPPAPHIIPPPTPQGRVPVGRQAPTFAVRQAPHPTPPPFAPPAPIPPPTPQGRVPVGIRRH